MTGSKLHPFSTSLMLRKIAGTLAVVVLPCQQFGEAQHVAEAETILEQGYGLIVIMNHFSFRDPLQVLSWLFRNPTAGRRPIAGPIAYHMHDTPIQFMTDRLRIQICPVVTAKTIELQGSKHRPGAGIREYLDAALETLSVGGILLLAPQGGRKCRLGKRVGRPLGNIVAHARRRDVSNFALLCVGLGMPDVVDYSRKKVGGLNLLRSYDLRVGQPITISEALERAGGIKMIDAWIFDRLSELLPPLYGDPVSRPPDPRFSKDGKSVAKGVEPCHETSRTS
jgi:hypothetical protein